MRNTQDFTFVLRRVVGLEVMGYGLEVMGWRLWVESYGLGVNVGANGNLPLYKKIYNKNANFHFALYTRKYAIKTKNFILPLYKKTYYKRHLQTNTITQLNADAVIFEHRFRTLLDAVEFYRFI